MIAITGDLKIDALLAGSATRWGVAGQVPTVSYSFMLKAPDYAASWDKYFFSQFTSDQKTATQHIFQQVSSLFQINFQETFETTVYGSNGLYGEIRFGNNYQGDQSSGYAYLPDPSYGPQGGDVYINNAYNDMVWDLVPGSFALATLTHEIGHALGLKHPGNYNSTGDLSSDGPFLPTSKDKTQFSLMSYGEHPDGLQRIDFGSYDILALTYLYGRRTQNTGDTVHRLSDKTGTYLSNLVDDGGVDTLDASTVTADMKLFLQPDILSSVGRMANGSASRDNFTLSFDALIENVIGGRANDFIMGNTANNRLDGGDGNDVLDTSGGRDILIGGSGNDVFSFNGAGDFIITDFIAGQDSVNFNLKQYGIVNLQNLLPLVTGVTQDGGDAVVHFVNNVASITFVGLPVSAITGDIATFQHYVDGVLI